MSTRCNVIIKNDASERNSESIILYHHHDGYPEGVGEELKKVLAQGTFSDKSELSEVLVGDYDGYEVEDGLAGDIEYLYTISLNQRQLKCQSINILTDETKLVFIERF